MKTFKTDKIGIVKTRRKAKKQFCIFLSLIMLFGIIPAALPVYAAEDDSQSKLEAIREELTAIPYNDYISSHMSLNAGPNGEMPYGSGEIIMTPSDYDAENSNAVGVSTSQELGKEAIYAPEEGTVSFKFNVQKEGFYNLAITYLQVVGKTSAIERMIKIDGKVPFKEARYITMTKTYVDQYEDFDENGMPIFKKDIKDNEIRPRKAEAPEWKTFLTEDSSGFVEGPFLYYLTAGEHILTFEAVRESVYINEIKFYIEAPLISYDDYYASQPQKKGNAEIPKIQAEKPVATSEIVIYPINDRSSAITEPQDSSRIRLNSIGGSKWQVYGQWIRYEFEIPAGGEGFYYITPRFKQAVYSGVYSSRKIRINGKVPFAEANRLRFNFSDDWQAEPLNDGTIIGEGKNATKKYFEFYLNEGKNVIEFEVSLGDMAEMLGRVEESVANLNEMYRKIRMITGATPDAYRDYGFHRLIPGVIEGMFAECINLREMSAQLEEIIGSKGEHTVMLEKIALQLDRMTENEDRIAPGLGTFKTNIGGLATWHLERRNQPLEIDYIKIQRVDDTPPKAEANFFQGIAFEFSSFVMSFFADYNSQGAMVDIQNKDEVVEVWLGSEAPVMGGLALAGRDQAQVIRQMAIDFTQQTNIQVNLKLVAAGSLLPSVLAGVGPDVAVANQGGTSINYAIRSAVLPLNYDKKDAAGNYSDDNNVPVEYSKGDPSRNIKSFDEVKEFFTPSALVPLTLQNDDVTDKSKLQVFALPECQTFPMLFYRKDIFLDLGIDVPQTWEELYAIVPELQMKNLEVGILPGMVPLTTFMFQQGIPLYKGDGIEINLDENLALDSFKTMTSLYTIYKFPITFDFANRFRSGEMPIAVQNYDLYNQLMVFAPEIRGMWEFVPLPGTIRPKTEADAGIPYPELGDGLIIDSTSPAGSTCTLMLRSAAQKNNTENAWAFMQWWVGAEAQGNFGNELVAMMGVAAKYPTANLEALENMPWPTADYKNLEEQFKYLEAVPEVPGGYIVTRNVDFAWKAVYNSGKSPVETMLDYIPEINKELSRKRIEFNMKIIERDRFGRRIDKIDPPID